VLMKFSEILFAVVLFCYASFAQEYKARIIISSDSDAAEYFINGEMAGKGNSIVIEKDTGSFIIKAVEGEGLWNPVVITDSIKINEYRDYVLNYNFDSKTLLRSDPEDAYVYRNDSLLGNTPLFIDKQSGVIKLKKHGYEDMSAEIANLQGVLKLKTSGMGNYESFYKRNLFKYMIGGLIILGGTTAYFKLKADDKFGQYELTGDDKLLRETRRYDLISGITFGALQINIGLILYYFLSE